LQIAFLCVQIICHFNHELLYNRKDEEVQRHHYIIFICDDDDSDGACKCERGKRILKSSSGHFIQRFQVCRSNDFYSSLKHTVLKRNRHYNSVHSMSLASLHTFLSSTPLLYGAWHCRLFMALDQFFFWFNKDPL
jgi:hypothetical protein